MGGLNWKEKGRGRFARVLKPFRWHFIVAELVDVLFPNISSSRDYIEHHEFHPAALSADAINDSTI